MLIDSNMKVFNTPQLEIQQSTTQPELKHTTTLREMRVQIHSSSPSLDKDAKLWAGQLYLSHTSEIVAKLLYKKFYRKTDCTILYGKWTTILREQAAMLSDAPTLSESVSNISIR